MYRNISPIYALCIYLALGLAPANAVTFNYSMNCPTYTTVGPITVLGVASTFTGNVTLTPGVPFTEALLPTNNLTRMDNNAAVGGTYLGTYSCTLTFGGVPTNFSRSFSLNVPPLPSPPNSSAGIMTTGAVSFTVDLGAQGKLDVSAPIVQTLGFDRLLINSGLIVVPYTTNTTLLLHDVLIQQVPLPPYLILNLIGMVILGLYLAQRGRRKKEAGSWHFW